MRGEVTVDPADRESTGITPACAGRRVQLCGAGHAHGDHPRVCGEKKIPQTRGWNRNGSPPRVRGEAWLVRQGTGLIRITPACAGRRRKLAADAIPSQDHPRVCGEKRTKRFSTSSKVGSPPRVRGEVALAPFLAPRPGITPACAGRRRRLRPTWSKGKDHPRVCGEKSSRPILF